nr:polyprotein [Fusarium incarnatum hypovirus 1]
MAQSTQFPNIVFPLSIREWYCTAKDQARIELSQGHEITCKCQLHMTPPSVQRAKMSGDPGLLANTLAQAPTRGPVFAAAWEVHHTCHASNDTRLMDLRFAELFVSAQEFKSYKSTRMPQEVAPLALKSNPDMSWFGMDQCWASALRPRLVTRAVRTAAYEILLSDFQRLLELCGKCESKPMRLVKVQSGLYHLKIDNDKKVSKSAGAKLYRDVAFAVAGSPDARIGSGFSFLFSRGGFTSGGLEPQQPVRSRPRETSVCWHVPPPRYLSRTPLKQVNALDAHERRLFYMEKKKIRDEQIQALRAAKVRRAVVLTERRHSKAVAALIQKAKQGANINKRTPVSWRENNRYALLMDAKERSVLCSSYDPRPTTLVGTKPKHGRQRDPQAGMKKLRSMEIQFKNISKKKEMRHWNFIRRAQLSMFHGKIRLAEMNRLDAFFHSYLFPGMDMDQVRILLRVMRGRVVCPTDGYQLDLVSKRGKLRDVSCNSAPTEGVSINIDGCYFTHLGNRRAEIRYKLSAAAWKARALSLLKDHQSTAPEVKGKGMEVIGLAKTSVPFTRPNLMRRMVNGFRVCAIVGGAYIYSRSGRFEMSDPRSPGEVISPLQTKIIDNHSHLKYSFTCKGLAKLWVDLGKRLDWRRVLAHSLGMNYSIAEKYMQQWYTHSGLDIVIDSPEDKPYNNRPGQVVHHYEEVPVLEPHNESFKPMAKKVGFKGHVKLCDGVSMPVKRFPRPTSDISLTFGDMHVVARNADDADVEVNPGPTQRPSLILDYATPTADTPASLWYARFYDDEDWEVNGSALESVINTYEPKYVTNMGRNWNVSEESASPHSYHASKTPKGDNGSEQIRLARFFRRHKRSRSDNPISQLFESEEHVDPYGSDDHDVEKNPGPATPSSSKEQERGRSTHQRSISEASALSVQTTNLDKQPERERSRTRSAIRKFTNAIGFTKNDLEKVRSDFGFDTSDNDILPFTVSDKDDIAKLYTGHLVIGHLPGDKKYHKPWRWPVWDSLLSIEGQGTLDKNYSSGPRFNRSIVAEVSQMIHEFFQRSQSLCLGRQEMAALAQHIKTEYSCPAITEGYALEIILASNEIVLHYTTAPSSEVAGRLWYYVSGRRYLHGGDDLDDNQRLGTELVAAQFTQGEAITDGVHTSIDPVTFLVCGARRLSYLQDKLDNVRHEASSSFEELQPMAIIYLLLGIVKRHEMDLSTAEGLANVFMLFKSMIDCPRTGAYAINFTQQMTTIKIYQTKRLTEENRERCWVMVEGKPLFHLGLPSIEEGAPGNGDDLDRPLSITNPVMHGRPSWAQARHYAGEMYDSISTLPQTRHMRVVFAVEHFQPATSVFCKTIDEMSINDVPWMLYPWLWCIEHSTRFWLTLFHFLRLWFNMFSIHRHPQLSGFSPNVTYPDDDYDDDYGRRSETFAVVTLGTEGDNRPVHLAAQTAGHYGIPTVVRRVRTMDGHDMENLRVGKVLQYAPDYATIANFASEGYKRILAPHVEVSMFDGLSYSLAPTSHWIHTPRFVDDWDKVTWVDYIPAAFMEQMNSIFSPYLRIGCLRKGSNFPRTVDGFRPLRKTTNLDATGSRVGWVSGSNNEHVIPHHIREAYERIPDGDHSEIFRHYSKIYMHGGAGTVQTAVACGCEVEICDPTMDRNYHTIPGPDDFHVPSVSPLMGYLVLSGFRVRVPVEIKVMWIISFLWNGKLWLFLQLIDYAIKSVAMLLSLMTAWKIALSIYVSVPLVILRLVLKQHSVTSLLYLGLWVLWEFPFFCLGQSWGYFPLVAWTLKKSWVRIVGDFLAVTRPRFYVEFEPAKLEKGNMPFPYGHWSVFDSKTSYRYEGMFLKGERHTLGGMFKFTRNKRASNRVKLSIRVPFNLDLAARRALGGKLIDSYSANHNCLTMIEQLISTHSLIGMIALKLMRAMIWFTLQPPESTLRWMEVLGYNIDNYRNSFLYSKLGFAATIEDVPLELDDEVTASERPTVDPSPTEQETLEENLVNELDIEDETSFEQVVQETMAISAIVSSKYEIDENVTHEIVYDCVLKKAVTDPLPDDNVLTRPRKDGEAMRTHLGDILDAIQHSISFIQHTRVGEAFICWLKGIGTRIHEFILPLLNIFTKVLVLGYILGEKYFRNFFIDVSDLITYAYGLEKSKRIKTAWGLTGLYRTGFASQKARLALEIAHMEVTERGHPVDDWNNMVAEINQTAKELGVGDPKHVGGPQRRPINLNNQLMTKREGDTIMWDESEYVRDPEYEKRVEAKIATGVPQGSDQVRMSKHFPEKITESINRYEPSYAKPTAVQIAFAEECADAEVEDHPNFFLNCDVTMPAAIRRYNKPKQKYRPGAFFSGPDGFRTREAAARAGFQKVADHYIRKCFREGKNILPNYVAFLKSQITNALKAMPKSMGGQEKQYRTVVAQDDFSYMQNQVVMMDRNKRDWADEFGAGAGMRLNQSMLKNFLALEEPKETFEGLYMMADATAFDSTIPNIIQCYHERLWSHGFKNHPSGNGANIASVAIAATRAKSSGWIWGLTEVEHSALQVVVPDQGRRDTLVGYDSSRFIDATYLSLKSVTDLISSGQTLGKLLLVAAPRQANIPNCVKNLGSFVVDNSANVMSTLRNKARYSQTFLYHEGGFNIGTKQPGSKLVPRAMYDDLAKFADAPIALLSNMHYKNRGGDTGGNETTPYNTLSLRAIYRMAWSLTMNRPPREFQTYNKMSNQGDDAMWSSFGKYGIRTHKQMLKFKEICAQMGITMTIDSTKDITKVEYLSKFVRRPTPQDSEDLAVWRRHKINEACNMARLAGKDPRTLDFSLLNNPKYVVYHSTPALWLRSTAIRYYQANKENWRTVSLARTAGHAGNCAFAPATYLSFAEEWVQDANFLLAKHNIWIRYEVSASRGQYKLPLVQEVNPGARKLQSLSPRQKAFLKELKGMMFPSYLKVMNVHMNTADIDPEAHDKLFTKLDKSWKGPNEIMAEFADQLQQFTDQIPDDYRKFMTGPSLQFAEKTFYTKNMLLEKFTYKQMLLESGDDEITFGDFSERIRRGPYACATDPYGFFEKKNNDPEFLKEVHDCNEWLIQGLVFWITFIYALTPIVEGFILSLWFFGPVYKIWMWSFFGLGKLYALLNTLYWHSKANSSAEISRMMPKDPYMMSKRACVFIVDVLPQNFGFIMMVPCAIVNLIPELCEAVGKINFKATQMKEPDTGNMPTENSWSRYAEEYLDILWESPTRSAYLAADTGTGKSTWWLAALYGARRYKNIRHVWVVSPYKSLRDNIDVPFGIKTQILMKGVQMNGDFVKSATYGHFAQARINQIDPDRDVVLFDEFHLQTMEIINALHFNPARTFLLSATPVDVPSLKNTPSLFPDIKRRFQPVVKLYDDNMDVVDAYKEAEHLWPHVMKKQQPRVLIVVPTVKQQSDTITLLQDLLPNGTLINPYSRLHRTEPPEGIIVSTPYVDVGTNFKNPPDVLIDAGKQVLIDRGKMILPLPWTDPDTDKQRQGRVARKGAGYVFKPHSAGTGPKGVTYSSPAYFAFKHVANHFKIQQLGSAPRPACKVMPWLGFNETQISIAEKKSVAMLHAMAYAGIKESQWQKFYNIKYQNKPLSEDYVFVDRVYADYQWNDVQLLPYSQARMTYNRQGITSTYFKHRTGGTHQEERLGRPFKPMGHIWVQYGSTLEENDDISVHRTDANTSIWGKLNSDLVKTRAAIRNMARKMPWDRRLEILSDLDGVNY